MHLLIVLFHKDIVPENEPQVLKVVKCIETESDMEVARVWREEGNEGLLLMGTKFPFGKMNEFWGWMVMLMAQECDCT